MPTYKNESRSYVCTHGFSWAPGESKRVPFIIDDPRLTEMDVYKSPLCSETSMKRLVKVQTVTCLTAGNP